MTAIYAIKTSDQISILADRAFYREDGTLTAIDGKTAVHESGFAMAAAGDHDVMQRAFRHYTSDAVEDYGEAVERVAGDLETCKTLAGYGLGEYPLTDLLFAGFDDTGAARMHVAAIGEHDAALLPDRRPWAVREVQHFSRGPFLGDADRDRLAVILRGREFAGNLFAEIHGTEMFSIFRGAKSRSLASDVQTHFVGGGVDLVTIRRDGVTVERLVDWDDKVGEKIAP